MELTDEELRALYEEVGRHVLEGGEFHLDLIRYARGEDGLVVIDGRISQFPSEWADRLADFWEKTERPVQRHVVRNGTMRRRGVCGHEIGACCDYVTVGSKAYCSPKCADEAAAA